MTSPYAVLDALPEIKLVWTNDERALKGRDARWFPARKVIAVKASLRRLKSRCRIAHELGHIVLGHGASCGVEFFDLRAEEAADEFAARLLLDDLQMLATELATTVHHGHAANNLNVTLDMFDTRLRTLLPDEIAVVDSLVCEIQAGHGC